MTFLGRSASVGHQTGVHYTTVLGECMTSFHSDLELCLNIRSRKATLLSSLKYIPAIHMPSHVKMNLDGTVPNRLYIMIFLSKVSLFPLS